MCIFFMYKNIFWNILEYFGLVQWTKWGWSVILSLWFTFWKPKDCVSQWYGSRLSTGNGLCGAQKSSGLRWRWSHQFLLGVKGWEWRGNLSCKDGRENIKQVYNSGWQRDSTFTSLFLVTHANMQINQRSSPVRANQLKAFSRPTHKSQLSCQHNFWTFLC